MQFKKHISLLLAFFLLVSNSGLAFNVHFCEGKIASITSIFSKDEVCEVIVEKEKSCCDKLEVSHKKCCSDKKVNLKNKIEKIVLTTFSFELDSFCFFNDSNFKITSPTSFVTSPRILDYCCDAHAPPFYKLYCQFTLFG